MKKVLMCLLLCVGIAASAQAGNTKTTWLEMLPMASGVRLLYVASTMYWYASGTAMRSNTAIQVPGITNTGKRVLTPVTQTGMTASSAAVVTAECMVLSSTGTIVSTAAPFISTTTATSGQIVQIINGHASYSITIQDKGTLSNSCLSLGGTTRALGPGDTIRLIYYDGVWRETAFANNQ